MVPALKELLEQWEDMTFPDRVKGSGCGLAQF